MPNPISKNKMNDHTVIAGNFLIIYVNVILFNILLYMKYEARIEKIIAIGIKY